MSRYTMMLALGVGALVLAGCNDRSDMRTDAGEARSEAEDGRMPQESLPADQGRPSGTPAPIQGSGMQEGAGNANATLAMSGSPSSHLVDGAGSAVYVLAGNTDGSKCDAVCEEVWPPVMAHDLQPSGGAGVESARIGTLEREGRIHVTYGGEPLYRYSGDAGADRTSGAGVDDQWGKWSLVGLDGQALPDPQ
ncbi:COG4315 family predicted lipoprotein [Luteimonas sp. A501]